MVITAHECEALVALLVNEVNKDHKSNLVNNLIT